MRVAYVIRFRKNGKVKRFRTTASSPKEAAQRCRGGQVISVRKASSKA
jgi:hypothetical protein